jgi:hypothetical protein
MVLTGDIALTGRVGSGQHFPFDHQRQALVATSQHSSLSRSLKAFRGMMKALRGRSGSVSTATSRDSFGCDPSTSNTSTYDALAVVHIKGDKQASGLDFDTLTAKSDKQQHLAGLDTAAAGAQASKRHQQGIKCDQHADKRSSSKMKMKMKAAAMFFASGLSYSAVSMPAFPVPITPYCPPVIC